MQHRCSVQLWKRFRVVVDAYHIDGYRWSKTGVSPSDRRSVCQRLISCRLPQIKHQVIRAALMFGFPW